MPQLLLPNRILSLSAEAADRLLRAGNGDAALLYLGLLRHGDVQKARRALEWTDRRAAAAFETLVKLSLAEGNVQNVAAPEEDAAPPSYQRSDIISALQNDPTFANLHQAMENAMGRKLSDSDRVSLYTIYDYLALPPEVIYLLTGWCVTLSERRYGPGRRPRMPMIKTQAFRWKRMGVDTLNAAEEFLAKEQKLLARENELLPLLDIHGRSLIEKEQNFLASWVDMGFDNEAIRLAYERTLFQTGKMKWSYMNSILVNWHKANLHTVPEIEARDKKPARQPARGGSAAAPAPDYQPSEERIRKNADWLDQFLTGQRDQEG